ncbi:DUF397 domain-containing protein [Streptomyces albidoflavus]|uniref:DUF397 domain-containing protein n=1 Tax=Streptomyces albidoflavus TaxID=1886 RepID=UPI0037B754A5
MEWAPSVALATDTVPVRDSKAPARPHRALSSAAWRVFVGGVVRRYVTPGMDESLVEVGVERFRMRLLRRGWLPEGHRGLPAGGRSRLPRGARS